MRSIFKRIDGTFFRFIIVGVINTLVGTGVMFGCYNLLHQGYWVSSAANYIVGSVVSFFLNKHFTFRNTDKSPMVVLRFIANIAVCYLLAYGIARPLVRFLLTGAGATVQDNGAMLVGMCLFVVLNYFGQRFFAFKNEDDNGK